MAIIRRRGLAAGTGVGTVTTRNCVCGLRVWLCAAASVLTTGVMGALEEMVATEASRACVADRATIVTAAVGLSGAAAAALLSVVAGSLAAKKAQPPRVTATDATAMVNLASPVRLALGREVWGATGGGGLARLGNAGLIGRVALELGTDCFDSVFCILCNVLDLCRLIMVLAALMVLAIPRCNRLNNFSRVGIHIHPGFIGKRHLKQLHAREFSRPAKPYAHCFGRAAMVFHIGAGNLHGLIFIHGAGR